MEEKELIQIIQSLKKIRDNYTNKNDKNFVSKMINFFNNKLILKRVEK